MILRCDGCGTRALVDQEHPFPFRCPHAGDGADHLLVRRLARPPRWPEEAHENPFVAYRSMFHSRWLALRAGLDDSAYAMLVRHLDQQIAHIEGHGFLCTPFGRDEALSRRLGFDSGGVYIKNETQNVSGSHKARHLMGIALHLEVVEALGWTRKNDNPLCIASCGNAALAAAVVARAAGRDLKVFIPEDAEQSVVDRLKDLRAQIHICERRPGELGDPCYLRFQEALAQGGLPFCCQGPDNGLTLEGGQTLMYEVCGALSSYDNRIDHVIIQVGGGALASSSIRALEEMVAMGYLPRMPRVHTVETQSAYPLLKAYERVQAKADELEDDEAALRYAAHHRNEFMKPWPTTPHSIAHGILDDETYDWHRIVSGMLRTKGCCITVSEERLAEAHRMAHEISHVNASATGTAGLAGLLELQAQKQIAHNERVLILYTGIER